MHFSIVILQDHLIFCRQEQRYKLWIEIDFGALLYEFKASVQRHFIPIAALFGHGVKYIAIAIILA